MADESTAKPKLAAFPSVEFDGRFSTRLMVELASDPESRARGLMHRESLDADRGMLFVFPEVVALGFWGENLLIPLSVGLIAADGTLLEIADLNPLDPEPWVPTRAYQFALEVNRGWFQRVGVTAGQRMRFISTEGPVHVR
ncbi:MAG: DUF192 domain-containing protein [Chloroflexota bacterium]